MTLHQLSCVKRWHVAHRRDHPIEYHAWDTVLMLWVLGFVGAPVELLMSQPLDALAVGLFVFVPSLYVRMRLQLHRRHKLRCDWEYTLRV